jgi:copper chaperone NosL
MLKLFRTMTPVMFLSLYAGLPVFSASQAPALSGKEKCPVCGMFVSKYPDWVATIQFNDGTHVAFDGPKDLFTYFLNLKKYNPGKS